MLIKKPSDIPPSEITPERWYGARREFLKRAAVLCPHGHDASGTARAP